MLAFLIGVIICIVLFCIFKTPIIWALSTLQRVVLEILIWYGSEYTIERVVLTIIILWLIRKVGAWLIEKIVQAIYG